VTTEHYDALILLCCWKLWKRRNEAVFRQVLLSLRQVLRLCKEDAALWRHRMPRTILGVALAHKWCLMFNSVM
jgi:hypothetical protein